MGTKFNGEETVNTDSTKRVILTFGGDKSFTLIEEVSALPNEFEITLLHRKQQESTELYSTIQGDINNQEIQIAELKNNENHLKEAIQTQIKTITELQNTITSIAQFLQDTQIPYNNKITQK